MFCLPCQRALPEPGPTPPELMNDLITLLPPVLVDTPIWEKNFGDVLEQPEKEYGPGDIVHVSFVSTPSPETDKGGRGSVGR